MPNIECSVSQPRVATGLVVSLVVAGWVCGWLPSLAAAAAFDLQATAAIDGAVAAAIEQGDLPGCVVTVGLRGKVIFQKAYGDRQVEPQRVPMTVDTVFDLASLTKPIATATSIMRLVAQQKIDLNEPVATYWPKFGDNGKESITVEQLLLHRSGLIADNPLSDYQHGPDEIWRRIAALKPIHPPGTKFVYSDVNFLVLGKLVERVSGVPLDEFAEREIFAPLHMTETGYRPTELLRPRIAPTEKRDGDWLRGDVHDPRAAKLDGVAGHAGLFSTADDLAKYAAAMAAGGRLGETSVLPPDAFAEMTRPRDLAGQQRALGWDIKSGYSSNRGDGLSERTFGHGGFTGTSLWIDPQSELFVIFLSNRLHPDGVGSVNRLAGRIGTLAAAAIEPEETSTSPAPGEPLRVVTYNIKHGEGTDGKVDLDRTAAVLQKLNPDVVALQEVDSRTTRSAGVEQGAELGQRLNMHYAFGSFMNYQGGRYGLAILSRHPIRKSRSIDLPKGNEPRVALAAEIELPSGDLVTLVDVHFDWVADDGYRFAQAQAVRRYLDDLPTPYILLGDFNDRPGSRTLKLLTEGSLVAAKPEDDQFTFSSTEPKIEIDHIVAAPPARWTVRKVQVIDEPAASDHRPVLAELGLTAD